MAVFTSAIKLQTVDVADITANGSMGSAATTVDIASSFHLNQTTAGVALTIDAPTVTTDSPIIFCSNVGTAATTLEGVPLEPGSGASFQWSAVNSKWNGIGDVGLKKYTVAQTLTAGANVITHNLNLATPSAFVLSVREVATGNTVEGLIVSASTANSITVNPLAAVVSSRIVVIG